MRIQGLLPEVESFERHLVAERRSSGQPRYTPRTAHAYALAVGMLLRGGSDLAAALAAYEPSPRWTTLRSALLAWAAWRKDEGLAARLRAIQPPPVNYRETKPPSEDDWDRIVASAAERVAEPRRSALLLVATSGLRINEVFQLTRGQVGLGVTNREIAIYQKGARTRDWAPSTQDRILLRNLAAVEGWRILRDVFDPTQPGETPTEQQRYDAAYHEVRKTLRAVCAAAGVDYVRPHRYRHAVANDLVHAGANIVDVQKALGHADSRTTDKFYLHSDAERQVDLKDRAAARHRR